MTIKSVSERRAEIKAQGKNTTLHEPSCETGMPHEHEVLMPQITAEISEKLSDLRISTRPYLDRVVPYHAVGFWSRNVAGALYAETPTAAPYLEYKFEADRKLRVDYDPQYAHFKATTTHEDQKSGAEIKTSAMSAEKIQDYILNEATQARLRHDKRSVLNHTKLGFVAGIILTAFTHCASDNAGDAAHESHNNTQDLAPLQQDLEL